MDIIHSGHLQRTPGHPPAWALAAAHQTDGAGQLWSVIAHTDKGDVPGKAKGGECWYPWGGHEHTTHDFSYIVGSYELVHNTGHTPAHAAPYGKQHDSGVYYPMIARTAHGTIPGKAKDGHGWYPYGGKEVETKDFDWVCYRSVLTNYSSCHKPSSHAHGHQTDGAGDLWCAIAHTDKGNVPGKAKGNECWWPWGGKENKTHDFSWVVGPYMLVKTHTPTWPAQGHQHDSGPYWCAVANTPHGKIPGKAKGDKCWYPYGDKEHETHDFEYVMPY